MYVHLLGVDHLLHDSFEEWYADTLVGWHTYTLVNMCLGRDSPHWQIGHVLLHLQYLHARVPWRSVLKSVLKECPKGVSWKSVLNKCLEWVSWRSVLKECLANVTIHTYICSPSEQDSKCDVMWYTIWAAFMPHTQVCSSCKLCGFLWR